MVLADESMSDVPILIYANKMVLPNALSALVIGLLDLVNFDFFRRG